MNKDELELNKLTLQRLSSLGINDRSPNFAGAYESVMADIQAKRNPPQLDSPSAIHRESLRRTRLQCRTQGQGVAESDPRFAHAYNVNLAAVRGEAQRQASARSNPPPAPRPPAAAARVAPPPVKTSAIGQARPRTTAGARPAPPPRVPVVAALRQCFGAKNSTERTSAAAALRSAVGGTVLEAIGDAIAATVTDAKKFDRATDLAAWAVAGASGNYLHRILEVTGVTANQDRYAAVMKATGGDELLAAAKQGRKAA